MTRATASDSELRHVTAAILAGGLGTRLRSVVSDRPKVLAEVGGRPFLAYLLDQLAEAGVGRVVLCTGYRGEQVEAAFGARYATIDLVYSREPSPLGTAGALRLAAPRLGSDPVLVLNGDSYCEVDLAAFHAWHRERGSAATLVVTEVPDCRRFGRVRLDPGGHVLGFDEKGGAAQPGWINAGVYLLSRGSLLQIPTARSASLETELFPSWVGRDLNGYRAHGRFLDIGTPESHASAERFFLAPRAAARRRFVALDRDGTILVARHYLSDPDEVQLNPGAADGLRRMRQLGLGLVVVTNQSAIGRGIIDRTRLAAIHQRLRELLAAEGIELDGIYYCPHLPEDHCSCRKPLAGLVERAAAEHGFDPRKSFVIGDNVCDVELGRGVGATTLLVRSGHGARVDRERLASPDHVVDDLPHAARVIENALQPRPQELDA